MSEHINTVVIGAGQAGLSISYYLSKENLKSGLFLGVGKDAAQLQIPTLLVKGSDSPRFFHAIVDQLDRILPLSRQEVVANTSHDVHQQNPEAFHKRVMEFLSYHN